MRKQRTCKKERWKEIAPQNTHADKKAARREDDWLSYSSATDNANNGFLVQREDVFEPSRMDFEEDKQIHARVRRKRDTS